MRWVLLAYLSTIMLANWAVERFGLVPVGFGLVAPAGVYVAGLAFTLRDLVHEQYGARVALLAIALGCVLSVLVSPALAFASALAFALSETLDLIVYTPLRERRMMLALVCSNVVGLIADSIVFLWLAFGSLAFVEGQIVGKLWMTLLAIALITLTRRTPAYATAHA